MSDNPIGDAARAARRLHGVPEGAACPLCGEQYRGCLVEVDKTILEEHHIAGVANLPGLTVWLCPTCHDKLHAGYLDAGIDLSHPPQRFVLKVVQVVLEACAVLFVTMAETFKWLAHLLGEFIDGLDREHPDWRDMAEATL
jgi:hypothetical protein